MTPKVAMTTAQIDQLLANAGGLNPDNEMVQTDLTINLDDLIHLAAEVAQGAGALADRVAFPDSELAGRLRGILGDPHPASSEEIIDEKAIQVFDDAVKEMGLPAAIAPLDPGPRPTSPIAIFWPIASKTAIFIYVASLAVPPGSGVVVNAPLPFGNQLPVSVNDLPGAVELRFLSSELLAATIEN